MGRRIAVVLVVLAFSTAVAGAAETVRWTPAAASNPGLNGSQWTTALSVHSRATDQTIAVQVAFLPDAAVNSNPTEVTLQVEPEGLVEVQDVVASLFGEHRAGALRLRSAQPFEASSRTFNRGSDVGTFGQGIPAVVDADMPQGWVLLGAANRPGADGVRTNLGLLNPTHWDIDVMVGLFLPETSEWVGPVTVSLGPYGGGSYEVEMLATPEGVQTSRSRFGAGCDQGTLRIDRCVPFDSP
jgi:hypothetical protein